MFFVVMFALFSAVLTAVGESFVLEYKPIGLGLGGGAALLEFGGKIFFSLSCQYTVMSLYT